MNTLDKTLLPEHYTYVEAPFFTGEGNHNVPELEAICKQYKEHTHQQQIIKQELLKYLEESMSLKIDENRNEKIEILSAIFKHHVAKSTLVDRCETMTNDISEMQFIYSMLPFNYNFVVQITKGLEDESCELFLKNKNSDRFLSKAKIKEIFKENIHELKCVQPYFDLVKKGLHNTERRTNKDRNFQVGDYLCQREYNPDTQKYTDAEPIYGYIDYVEQGGKFGLKEGFVALSIDYTKKTIQPTIHRCISRTDGFSRQ